MLKIDWLSRARMDVEIDCRRDSISIQQLVCLYIHGHNVSEDEVIEVLGTFPGEDRNGREGSRVALGQTASGRYLRVVYVPDPEPDSLFVITAYELTGKPLAAYRRHSEKEAPMSNDKLPMEFGAQLNSSVCLLTTRGRPKRAPCWKTRLRFSLKKPS